MKPDRSNYEIWFTDWLDGNLSEQQAGELKLFLGENPDLEEELNGLALVSLNPPELTFSGKKRLEQSPERLSESQFEHLCIASLENDLTPEQKTELDRIISTDETRRNSFELIQKLKLKPMAGSFAWKNSVKKLTTGQKILRLSVIGLSAAATIALVISIFRFLPQNPEPGTQLIVQNSIPDSITIETRQALVSGEEEPLTDLRNLRPAARKSVNRISSGAEIVQLAETADQEVADSATLIQRVESPGNLKVAVPQDIFKAYMAENSVIRVYEPGYIPPLMDNRSNVELFMARLFHERIMKDPNAGTRPVKSFDLAQAGITGLNKLFGWEIALQKNTDDNGNTRSYNFSSGLLKFNAPVKKPEKAL